jgi:hypothetical protein
LQTIILISVSWTLLWRQARGRLSCSQNLHLFPSNQRKRIISVMQEYAGLLRDPGPERASKRQTQAVRKTLQYPAVGSRFACFIKLTKRLAFFNTSLTGTSFQSATSSKNVSIFSFSPRVLKISLADAANTGLRSREIDFAGQRQRRRNGPCMVQARSHVVRKNKQLRIVALHTPALTDPTARKPRLGCRPDYDPSRCKRATHVAKRQRHRILLCDATTVVVVFSSLVARLVRSFLQ